MARWISAVPLQAADGHGDIVDGAEALAVAGKGVVEAAADIEPDARLEGQARRQDGAARRQPEGLHHLPRVGDLQPQDLLIGQGAVAQPGDPPGVVHQQHVLIGGRLGLDEIFRDGEARRAAGGRAAT